MQYWNDFYACSGEKTKIHSPVFTLLLKSIVSCKRITIRMFQYKYALLVEDVCAKYKVRQLLQARVIIGRIRKNNIKGLDWLLQVPESICPKHCHLVELHASAAFLNKFEMQGGHFNSKHRPGPPGGKFIGDAAGTGEQVQHIQSLNIVLVNQDVKEALFCKISGRPGFEFSRWADLLAS